MRYNDAYYQRKLEAANQQIELLLRQLQEQKDQLAKVNNQIYKLRKEAQK